MRRRLVAVLIGSCLGVNAAWAGSQLEDTVSNCTGINCGAMALRGVYQTNEPFVVQVFSAEGECLRLDVDAQTQDLAMAVLSPAVNALATNDDRDFAGNDFRPLIYVDPVPATGWYTVLVSYWDWAPTQAKFILKYGRYPTGNPNCPAVATAGASHLTRPSDSPAKIAAPAESSPGAGQ
jgi:hypothetical protein